MKFYFDDLPDEAEDDVFSFFHDEIGFDVDDGAPDGFGRFNGKVEVLDLLVDNFRVDVDCCRRNWGHFAESGSIDQFAWLGETYQRITPSSIWSKISL